ncbi:related to monooxigenase [Rhynchosporium agropyri]|uniref:Related to monooxigenase n=1 Tax=Rhynchosporium agropyri TaxID=914238 RepID=A0A1E1LEX6_9HELO|nr:related to monooxigenase [Rhynchosporium agropyri]
MPSITLQEKYKQEREARLNEKGLGQYLNSSKTKGFISHEDPWVESGTPVQRPVPDGGHVKIAIFGAGFGGLCAAARALTDRSASSPEDFLIIDRAGGFGGTWWHNRYPGLMCDIESYLYLPLLEETGYMPTRKYASGEEIRKYSDLVAQHFNLHSRAMFQTSGDTVTWDDQAHHWKCEVIARPKGQADSRIRFTADYVIIASGGFTEPKIPDVPGLADFQGRMLHTGRWNYKITGGSPSNRVLSGLEGKKVAIIGTGATAIQAVPAVARYAGELYVFQRTPSAVDERGNRDTDPEEWKKIAGKKGWQASRADNLQAFTEGKDNHPDEDLVDDGFSRMPTISGAWGNSTVVKPEDVEAYVGSMHELDQVRSDRVRQRVLDIVKDKETAKALQAWYPGWCKRPTYHDEYLPTFNRPNVHLIDTAPKGVTALAPTGIIHNGTTYPVDIIIWSTGYGSPMTESLAGKAGINVTGVNGICMENQFQSGQLLTLHGLIARGFPNMFLPGFSQAGVGVNQTQRLDAQALQFVYMIREAEKRTREIQNGRSNGTDGSPKTVIQPTQQACDYWADQCASKAHMLATMGGCLPSYFNAEGASQKMTKEQQAGAARLTLWGQGYLSYARILKEWRAKGEMEGLSVEAA